jgi:hypothetical protein
VTGEPGAGKSTLLEMTVAQIARKALMEHLLQTRALEEIHLPIWIGFADVSSQTDLKQAVEAVVRKQVEDACRHAGLGASSVRSTIALIMSAYEHPNSTLLVDAPPELVSRQAWSRFLSNLNVIEGNAIVAGGRPKEWSGRRLAGNPVCYLVPRVEEPDCEKLAKSWVKHDHGGMPAETYVERWREVQDVVRTPLAFRHLCGMIDGGGQALGRFEIFRDALKQDLRRADDVNLDALLSVHSYIARTSLYKEAFLSFEPGEEWNRLSRQAYRACGVSPEHDELFDKAIVRCGLIEGEPLDTRRFRHTDFQYGLAQESISGSAAKHWNWELVRLLLVENGPQWDGLAEFTARYVPGLSWVPLWRKYRIVVAAVAGIAALVAVVAGVFALPRPGIPPLTPTGVSSTPTSPGPAPAPEAAKTAPPATSQQTRPSLDVVFPPPSLGGKNIDISGRVRPGSSSLASLCVVVEVQPYNATRWVEGDDGCAPVGASGGWTARIGGGRAYRAKLFRTIDPNVVLDSKTSSGAAP